MMGFLNYAILAALSLGTIPLLIHLLNRQRKIRMPFSTIRYIRQVHQKKAKKLQLKKILLLIIRTLMVLLLVLAIARPLLQSGLPGVTPTVRGGKTYLIMIDNSASMLAVSREGKLLEQALTYTGKLVGRLGEGNTFIIGWLDKNTGQLALARSGNLFLTRKILERVPETEYSLLWSDLFRDLEQQIEPPVMPLTGMFVLSDGQMLRYHPDQAKPFLQKFPQCRIQLVNILERDPFNLTVDTLYFPNPQFIVNSRTQVQAVIHNNGEIPASEINLDLYIDHQRVAQKSISLEKSGRQLVDFSFTLKTTGIHQGWVRLQDDDLSEDNRYYFTFSVPESLRILMISDTGTANYPLARAITPIDTAILFSLDTVSVFNLPSLDYNRYDGIILNQITAFPYYLMSNIRSYLGRNRNVLYLLPMDGDMGLINRSFFDFLELPTQLNTMESAYNRALHAAGSASDGRLPFYTLQVNPASDMMMELGDPDYWKNTRVLARYDFITRRSEGISTPLSFSDHKPALMVIPAPSGGKTLVSAFPLEDTYTDLVYHPIFVPYVQKILTFLVSRDQEFQSRQFWSHQSIPTAVFADLDPQTAVLKRNDIELGRLDGTERLYEPGNYRAEDDRHALAAFSVNLPAAESEFNPDGPPSDSSLNVQHLHDETGLNHLVDSMISGMEMAYYLLILVALLFVLESYLARE